MAEYIYAVVGTVFLSELCMMLMPEGGMKRFAKTAVGVLVMLMLLTTPEKCSLQKITWSKRDTPAENAYKTSYSDIIMEIYTRESERAEGKDGEESLEP